MVVGVARVGHMHGLRGLEEVKHLWKGTVAEVDSMRIRLLTFV